MDESNRSKIISLNYFTLKAHALILNGCLVKKTFICVEKRI